MLPASTPEPRGRDGNATSADGSSWYGPSAVNVGAGGTPKAPAALPIGGVIELSGRMFVSLTLPPPELPELPPPAPRSASTPIPKMATPPSTIASVLPFT